MSAVASLPLQGLQAGFRRFTVAEYHGLIQHGFLTESDRLELIEGYLVHKMPQNSPHAGSVFATQDAVIRLLPPGWVCRVQSPITVQTSEPEPDVAIVRGDRRTYFARHPGPADFGFVIEVSDSTLAADRADKQRVYARAGIPIYWIVNLEDLQVEVYTDPQPTDPNPHYATRTDYRPSDAVPVDLDGTRTGVIAVDDLLP